MEELCDVFADILEVFVEGNPKLAALLFGILIVVFVIVAAMGGFS